MIGYKTIEEFTLEECDEFLKRTDIGADEYQRVEKRKAYLLAYRPEMVPKPQMEPNPETIMPQKTIMELFPEYKFMPTSLREHKDYAHIADYVCTNYLGNTLIYVMYVKNRKFGVCEMPGLFSKAKVVVPAEYDKLSWRKRNKILDAEKDGKKFLIDVYGNKLS